MTRLLAAPALAGAMIAFVAPPSAAGPVQTRMTNDGRYVPVAREARKAQWHARVKPARATCPPARRVVSRKTGATACVGARHRARFQAYVDDVEAQGAAIHYMGGAREGHCSPASQHACEGGAALDLCQDRRGHVSAARACKLPRPPQLAAIAARHGLFEGGLWCNGDYGHAQVRPSRPCRSRAYAVGSWGRGRGGDYSARRRAPR